MNIAEKERYSEKQQTGTPECGRRREENAAKQEKTVMRGPPTAVCRRIMWIYKSNICLNYSELFKDVPFEFAERFVEKFCGVVLGSENNPIHLFS